MTVEKNLVTINSRKFDGTIHRSWRAKLIKRENSLLVFIGEFENEITHPHLGIIRRGTVSYEFYWTNHWFNVFRFHEPEGALRNFYCNINQPPRFADGVLDYVDLDVDILVWQDFRYEILDLDEFAANSKKHKYPKMIITKVQDSLNEIIGMIESRAFPFNGDDNF